MKRDKKENRKCHWCKRFIGSKGQNAPKEPHIFYCASCYKKGIEIEEEAMYGR